MVITSGNTGLTQQITGERKLRVQVVAGSGSASIEGNQDAIGFTTIKEYTGDDWEMLDVANCIVKFNVTGDAVLSIIIS